MSKQKCRISKKRSNFSIISNSVAQALNYNLAALGLYVYLFSLPHDWEFHKSHLRKVCDIGEKKLNSLLAILSDHKLINVIQTRNENGQFSHFDIHIDDGTAFIHSPSPDVQNDRPVKNGGAVKQTYKEDIKAFNKDDKNQEREHARKKRVPLSNDYIPNKGMDSMSQDVANRCNTTSDKLLFKFKNLMKSNGKTSLDWDAEYGIFLQREKPQFSGTPAATQSRNVNISSNSYGGMRDFTQERIDRENGITHGSEISGDNTGRTGMHQAAKHLFQEHAMGGISQSNSR